MVGKVFCRDKRIAMVKTPDGLRAGFDINDLVWQWLRLRGYNIETRRACSCEPVRECTQAECNRLRMLVESGQVEQTACFTEAGTFLLAVVL